jgi:murein DD-endopeptidase MepM/ murein hydrolase activator NlpD
MSTGIGDLTKRINELHAAIKSTGSEVNTTFSTLKAALGNGGQRGLMSGGQGNSMFGSLSTFSTQGQSGGVGPYRPTSANQMESATFSGQSTYTQQAAQAQVGSGIVQAGVGLVQMAAAPVIGAYGMTMDSSGIVNRAGAYYQAALRSPGMNRLSLEKATFSALNGGMTSIGSDAAVANTLVNAGYVPGSQNYINAVKQVGGAANYLGMANQNAATAIAGLQSGTMGANLYQYGITTMDTSGNSKSVGDIAQQLYKVMFPNGGTKESIQKSIQSGYAGLNLQGLNMSPDQQQMITQALIDISAGKNPDLASAKSAKGNMNPFSAMYKMNNSQTSIQQSSETSTLNGLNAAADTVVAFNNALRPVIDSLALFKGYLDGMSGTNVGRGIKAGSKSFMSGVSNFISGAAGVLAGVALLGGGTPGYGGKFSRSGPKGGGTPGGGAANALISATYGATDSSGIWASTGNTHQGTDYDVPLSTPVYATQDGYVSGKTLSSDYGNAVIIDHPGGYSTIYAHLSNKEVSPGDRVFKGTEVGKSGKSGNTTGPSLHYEVWHGDNNPVSPTELQGAGDPVMAGIGGGSTSSALLQQQSLANQTGSASSNPSLGAANNSNLGSAAEKSWATSFLTAMGAPVNDANVRAVSTWAHFEGGLSHNNPLNTGLKMPGSTDFNTSGIQTYGSLDQGTQAIIQTLEGNQADTRGYKKIVEDLMAGAPTGTTLNDINNSAWRSGKTGDPGYNFPKGGGTPGYGANLPDPTSSAAASVQAASNLVNNSGNTVNVYLTIAQASDSEAILFAKKVESYLNNNSNITTIGSA